MLHRSHWRPLLVLLTSWAAAGVLARRCFAVAAAVRGARPSHPLTVDALLVDVAAWALAGAVLMLLLSFGLVALEALVGERLPVVRRVAAVGCPPGGRRLALALCGLSIAAPLATTPLAAAPAMAHDHDGCASTCPAPSPAPSPAPQRVGLDGLPMPDLPSTAGRAPELSLSRLQRSIGPHPVEAAPRVTVQVGDSLWRIAQRELTGSASNTSVAARVDEWYVHNRAVIGPDRNLIFPGTELDRPEVTP